ncbi:hypothetical protein MKK69_26690 [Methylobacterium sp. J-026]|nr:hypothetical protein [Methylobacterium sp. J-026]MCJ2137589.1 hypothetical protein [Methylobacterium sp. J-026]
MSEPPPNRDPTRPRHVSVGEPNADERLLDASRAQVKSGRWPMRGR